LVTGKSAWRLEDGRYMHCCHTWRSRPIASRRCHPIGVGLWWVEVRSADIDPAGRRKQLACCCSWSWSKVSFFLGSIVLRGTLLLFDLVQHLEQLPLLGLECLVQLARRLLTFKLAYLLLDFLGILL